MIKPMTTLPIIVLVAVVIGAAWYTYGMNRPVTTQLKTFTWPDDSFSFSYREFRGWEVKEVKAVSEEESFIWVTIPSPLSDKSWFIPPGFSVRKVAHPEYSSSPRLENPHGIQYEGDVTNSLPGKPVTEARTAVTFYTPEFAVEIKLFIPDEAGFSHQQFFDSIIQSFKPSPRNEMVQPGN